MKILRNEEKLKDYQMLLNPFGKYISEYIAAFIATGQEDASLLTFGFDVGAWNNNTIKKRRQGTPTPLIIVNEEEKKKFIRTIIEAIHRKFESYYPRPQQEMLDLYHSRKDHFLPLRQHLEILTRAWKKDKLHEVDEQELQRRAEILNQLRYMRLLLLVPLRLHAIDQFPLGAQDAFLRWAYQNEIQ